MEWFAASLTLARLAYQSIGVIYGDIGTSPLYVYSSTFSSEPSHDDLLGALSLIIWSITLIVTIKYVLIVLYANDEGEGGTFAIYSLLSRYVSTTSSRSADPNSRQTVQHCKARPQKEERVQARAICVEPAASKHAQLARLS